jgi:hypothetical protein
MLARASLSVQVSGVILIVLFQRGIALLCGGLLNRSLAPAQAPCLVTTKVRPLPTAPLTLKPLTHSPRNPPCFLPLQGITCCGTATRATSSTSRCAGRGPAPACRRTFILSSLLATALSYLSSLFCLQHGAEEYSPKPPTIPDKVVKMIRFESPSTRRRKQLKARDGIQHYPWLSISHKKRDT